MADSLITMAQIPDIYEELTWKLLGTFPKCYQRVDRVPDTYHYVLRARIEQFKSDCTKKNGENKTRLKSSQAI